MERGYKIEKDREIEREGGIEGEKERGIMWTT